VTVDITDACVIVSMICKRVECEEDVKQGLSQPTMSSHFCDSSACARIWVETFSHEAHSRLRKLETRHVWQDDSSLDGIFDGREWR
jgi:hypothetical protein